MNKAFGRPAHPWLTQTLALLTLVGSVVFATALQAQTPPPEELLWSCVSVDDGQEWECNENPDYQQPQAADAKTADPQATDSQTADSQTAGTQQPDAATGQPTSNSSEKNNQRTADTTAQQDTPASSATAGTDSTAASASTATAATSSDERGTTRSDPAALDLQPAPEPEPQRATPTSGNQFSRTPSAHECQAEGDSWNCTSNPMADKRGTPAAAAGYVTAYPDAYAQAEAHTGKGTSSSTQTARQPQGQWDCQPSADGQNWRCQPLAGSARQQTPAETPVQAATAVPYSYLDWYSLAETDAQTHCSGHYVQPLIDSPDADLPANQQSTYLTANRTRTRGGNFTLLEGDIGVRKGEQLMRAQNGQVDHESQFVELEGQVLYRRPDTLLLGNSATLDQQKNEAWFHDAQFVFHDAHLRGEADSIRHYDDSKTQISQGSFTRCEPGDDSWKLVADEINLYHDEGYGIATHATLRIADVPVFYLPLIHFPIDDRRKSGFLTPSLSYTGDEGLDVATPYYFNLAPHYDDTLTPRYIENRGLMLENEFRYLHPKGHYDLSLAALPNDDQAGDDRWLFALDHAGRPANRWYSRVDYTSVSDDDYFDDLGTGLNVSERTHLNQLGQLSYQGHNWQASARAQSYQTITDSTKPYKKLPQLQLNGAEYFADDTYRFSYLAQYTDFYRDNDGLTGFNSIVGQRFYLESEFAAYYRWPWAYLRPNLRLTHTSYSLDDQPTGQDNNPSRTLPLFSVDSGIYFDRPTHFNDQRYTQTLEPRLFYLYVPEEDQSELPAFDTGELEFTYGQLFRDNRFSGRDRIGDAHQVTAALTTRFLTDRGAELFNASIGQIFYLQDREVRLNPNSPDLTDESSDFVAQGLWQVTEHMRFTADGQWNNSDFSNVKRNFKLRYKSDVDHQFNIGYRYNKESQEQLDISTMWPINNNWSLLARWLEDIENNETLDRILGLEYENCCWKVRTLYRRWIDDDDGDDDDPENSGIFLQFTLKGLGTSGTSAAGDGGASVDSFLEDIIGFEEREYDE